MIKRTFKVPQVLLRWKRQLRLSLTDFHAAPPVLVHQMGKVGSSSVYNSLRRAKIANPIYHTHFLSYSSLNEVENYYRNLRAMGSVHSVNYWRHVRRKIDRYAGQSYIISLVREPVGRLVSDVFQNLTIQHQVLLNKYGEPEPGRIISYLSCVFKKFDEKTDYACTWFDKEILDVFGLDVFQQPFNTHTGYAVLENERARILVMRLEDLSRVFHEAIEETFNFDVQLLSSNEATKKNYRDFYSIVQQRIVLPKEDCQKIYASRYACHFYTKEEQEKFIARWTGNNGFI